MLPDLLKQQYARLVGDPSDTRLLKQLSVDAGSRIRRSNADELLQLRTVMVESQLTLNSRSSVTSLFASAALTALIDATQCAWEAAVGGEDDLVDALLAADELEASCPGSRYASMTPAEVGADRIRQLVDEVRRLRSLVVDS